MCQVDSQKGILRLGGIGQFEGQMGAQISCGDLKRIEPVKAVAAAGKSEFGPGALLLSIPKAIVQLLFEDLITQALANVPQTGLLTVLAISEFNKHLKGRFAERQNLLGG